MSSFILESDGRLFCANGYYVYHGSTYHWRLNHEACRVEWMDPHERRPFYRQHSQITTNTYHKLKELTKVKPDKVAIRKAINALSCDRAAVTKLVESVIGESIDAAVQIGHVYQETGSKKYISFGCMTGHRLLGLWLSGPFHVDTSGQEYWNHRLLEGTIVHVADSKDDFIRSLPR